MLNMNPAFPPPLPFGKDYTRGNFRCRLCCRNFMTDHDLQEHYTGRTRKTAQPKKWECRLSLLSDQTEWDLGLSNGHQLQTETALSMIGAMAPHGYPDDVAFREHTAFQTFYCSCGANVLRSDANAHYVSSPAHPSCRFPECWSVPIRNDTDLRKHNRRVHKDLTCMARFCQDPGPYSNALELSQHVEYCQPTNNNTLPHFKGRVDAEQRRPSEASTSLTYPSFQETNETTEIALRSIAPTISPGEEVPTDGAHCLPSPTIATFQQHIPEITITSQQHGAPPAVKSSVNKRALGPASLTARENRRSWSGAMDTLSVEHITRGLTEGLSPGLPSIAMPPQDVLSIPQASDGDNWDVNEYASSNFEITVRAPTPDTKGRAVCSEFERELCPEGENRIEHIYATSSQSRINVSADEVDNAHTDELGDLPNIAAVSPTQDKPSLSLHPDGRTSVPHHRRTLSLPSSENTITRKMVATDRFIVKESETTELHVVRYTLVQDKSRPKAIPPPTRMSSMLVLPAHTADSLHAGSYAPRDSIIHCSVTQPATPRPSSPKATTLLRV